jgi:hypothetical protein
LETEGSGGTVHVKQGDLRGCKKEKGSQGTALRKERYRPWGRASTQESPMVVTKPGNAGGATGCRKVET